MIPCRTPRPFRRPLPPRIKVSYPKAMTVALGALYDSGVVICADSLVTTGTIGWHQSKIRGCRLDCADVLFALAGAVSYADSAWDSCLRRLRKLPKVVTEEELEDTLRKTVAREYKNQILDQGFQHQDEDYWLMCVTRVAGGRSKLYRACQTVFIESSTGLESIGAGHDVAQFILKGAHHPHLTDGEVCGLCANAIGLIKNINARSCRRKQSYGWASE